MRLPAETPARVAFNEAIKPTKRKRGPKTTWIDMIQRDFDELEININIKQPQNIRKLVNLCSDRQTYYEKTNILNDAKCGESHRDSRK